MEEVTTSSSGLPLERFRRGNLGGGLYRTVVWMWRGVVESTLLTCMCHDQS